MTRHSIFRGTRALTVFATIALAFSAIHVVRAAFSDTVSSSGNTFSVATLPAPSLGTPTVSGTGASATVALSWTAGAGDFASSFDVLRLTGACGTPASAVTNVATTSYTDTPGAAGTYCYAIRGKFQNWLSPLSNVRQVTIEEPPATGVKLYLHNETTQPSKNTSLQSNMPMNTSLPTNTGSLPNYGGDGPGRMIKKDSGGASQSDITKYANWRWTPTSEFSPAGNVTINTWVAADGWHPNKTTRIQVWIRRGSTTLCSSFVDVATPNTANAWAFVNHTFNCNTSGTVTTSQQLELKITVTDPSSGSPDDLMFAYDTTAFPAFIEFD